MPKNGVIFSKPTSKRHLALETPALCPKKDGAKSNLETAANLERKILKREVGTLVVRRRAYDQTVCVDWPNPYVGATRFVVARATC